MNTEPIKHQKDSVKKIGEKILHWFEVFFGVLALISVITFASYQILNFSSFDWSNIETYRSSLKVILGLAIGTEVARMLFSYNLNTLIELAVFIVIRKMLLIEERFIDLFLGVLCLAVLFTIRHFFSTTKKTNE